MRMVDASAWFPKLSVLPLHQVFAPIGELGGFSLFGVMLTSSRIFAVVFMSLRVLCAYVRVRDASASFPGLCGLSGRGSGILGGEFNFFTVVLGLSDVSIGFLESFAMLGTCSTRRFGLRASLARPCAVLRLRQVSLALLTCLQSCLRACARVWRARFVCGPFWLAHARFCISGG